MTVLYEYLMLGLRRGEILCFSIAMNVRAVLKEKEK